MFIIDPERFELRYSTRGDEVRAASLHDGILVDPVDRPDDFTPLDKRSPREVLTWWRLPFIVTVDGRFSVRCLDGGAHDRTTVLGDAETLDAAAHIARCYVPRVSPIAVLRDR